MAPFAGMDTTNNPGKPTMDEIFRLSNIWWSGMYLDSPAPAPGEVPKTKPLNGHNLMGGIGGNPGPTTSNLIMEAGSVSREELLEQTPRGLYVTQLMGFGFNPVTGDFSRGAQGFWIEGGELTFPVSEVTIAANFDQILKRIDLVANDLELRSSTAAPTFRVSHMTLAGTSKS